MRARLALWCCTILGHHPWRYRVPLRFDGVAEHMLCSRCGFEGINDRQGNLF